VAENIPHYTMSDTDFPYRDRLEKYIKEQKGHLESSKSMYPLANWLYTNEYFESDSQKISTTDLKDRIREQLEHSVDTVLGHLEDIEVVAEVSNGGGKNILHIRTDTLFFDPNASELIELVDEEISRFHKDLHEQDSQIVESEETIEEQNHSVADGGESEPAGEQDDSESTEAGDNNRDVEQNRFTTLRTVAADALSVRDEMVEEHLTEPSDHFEKIERYSDVIEAIIDSESVERGHSYEPIDWRNSANKWVLTTVAKARKENKSLFD
jgi:hypothetical protein